MVWVKDASRSVPTVAALLHDERRTKLLADVKADYDALRARHAAKHDRPMVTLERGPRQRARPIDWTGYQPPARLLQQDRDVSPIIGRRGDPARRSSATTTSPSCASYIDWQPFFNAWEMKG